MRTAWGAKILTWALKDLSLDSSTATTFNQIILAAPDIDRDVFIQLTKIINRTADRITLYASSADKALQLSRTAQGYPRAGDSGRGLTLTPGVDTIVATSVHTGLFSDPLSHSYFLGPTVLADMFSLMKYDLAPNARFGLTPEIRGSVLYWEFHP